MVHLMSAGRIRYLATGREGAEDAGVPAARSQDGGELVLTEARQEEARRRVAASAGCGRGGARASRPGGRHARRGDARADPGRRLAPAPFAAPRPAAIAGIGRAWANEILNARGSRPTRSRPSSRDEETERLAAAIHDELARGLELRLRAPRTSRPTASTTGSASRARTAARRSRGSTSRSTRSTTAPSARPTAGC